MEIGFLIAWISVGLAWLALSLSAKNLEMVQVLVTALLFCVVLDLELQYRVNTVWRVSVYVCYTCEYARQMLAGFQAAGSPPLAFLALVVTWWHTVASGVQSGSPRANKMIQSSRSVAVFRPSIAVKQIIIWEVVGTSKTSSYKQLREGKGFCFPLEAETKTIWYPLYEMDPKEKKSAVLLIVQCQTASCPENHRSFQSPYCHKAMTWLVCNGFGLTIPLITALYGAIPLNRQVCIHLKCSLLSSSSSTSPKVIDNQKCVRTSAPLNRLWIQTKLNPIASLVVIHMLPKNIFHKRTIKQMNGCLKTIKLWFVVVCPTRT